MSKSEKFQVSIFPDELDKSRFRPVLAPFGPKTLK